MQPIRPSFSQLPSSPRSDAISSSNAENPFDEMNLSEDKLDKKVEALKTKGYFTVRASESTMKFLQKFKNQSDAQWQDKVIHKSMDLTQNEHAKKTTNLAERVLAKVSGEKAVELQPNEMEVRGSFKIDPSIPSPLMWHQDTAPKKLTCLTTLEGKGTEFVSPETAKEKFEQGTFKSEFRPKQGEESVKNDIREAKKEKFYFFAANGLANEAIPKLVHRSPHEQGRSIFMARWIEAKNTPPKHPTIPTTSPYPEIHRTEITAPHNSESQLSSTYPKI